MSRCRSQKIVTKRPTFVKEICLRAQHLMAISRFDMKHESIMPSAFHHSPIIRASLQNLLEFIVHTLHTHRNFQPHGSKWFWSVIWSVWGSKHEKEQPDKAYLPQTRPYGDLGKTHRFKVVRIHVGDCNVIRSASRVVFSIFRTE